VIGFGDFAASNPRLSQYMTGPNMEDAEAQTDSRHAFLMQLTDIPPESHTLMQESRFDAFKASLGKKDPLRAPEGTKEGGQFTKKGAAHTPLKRNLLQNYPVLGHSAVAEVDNPALVKRYKGLMDEGSKIYKDIPNPTQHFKAGIEKYGESVRMGEDPRISHRNELAGARKLLAGAHAHHGYSSIPTYLDGNTKTDKNVAMGDICGGTTLAPHTMHGMGDATACGASTPECRDTCLGFTTGKNAMLSNLNHKIRKHQAAVMHPEAFAREIHAQLLNHVDSVAEWNKELKKKGQKPVDASWRPNMVTDYPHHQWSRKIIDHVTDYAKKKGVNFLVRDYTKVAGRLYHDRSPNYFMALSHTGTNHEHSNDKHVSKALENGHTVAAVVDGDATHLYDHASKRYYPLVNGDDDDLIERRHKEAGHKVNPNGTGTNAQGQLEGVVSALHPKGISNAEKLRMISGNFVNKTVDHIGPGGKKMRVIEINKGK